MGITASFPSIIQILKPSAHHPTSSRGAISASVVVMVRNSFVVAKHQAKNHSPRANLAA